MSQSVDSVIVSFPYESRKNIKVKVGGYGRVAEDITLGGLCVDPEYDGVSIGHGKSDNPVLGAAQFHLRNFTQNFNELLRSHR